MLGSNFRCNICGEPSVFGPIGDWRETPSCVSCGSTVRLRGVIHCLMLSLFGEGKAIPDLARSERVGIGLSDWDGYGDRLARKFDYTNTFYHQEPRLDIVHPGERWRKSADFLISSDVFEHVPVPTVSPFNGAAAVLRSRGILVLTVPYGNNDQTLEHYPELKDFSIVELGSEWIMTNRAADGTLSVHRDLLFHGGPGTTLEMRIFSLGEIIWNLIYAGFQDIRIHNQDAPEWGVFNPHPFGLPITARQP